MFMTILCRLPKDLKGFLEPLRSPRADFGILLVLCHNWGALFLWSEGHSLAATT